MNDSSLLHRTKGALRRLFGLPEIHRGALRRFQREHRRPVTVRATKPPTLAVVMPIHGHARYVAAALSSVAAQTRLPDELVLVFDASPDDSWAVVEGELAGWSAELRQRVVVVQNDRNVGQAESLNRGVAASRSELITILNDDDALYPFTLETVLGVFAREPDVHLFGGHATHFSGDADIAGLWRSTAAPPAPLAVIRRTPDEVVRARRANDLNVTHSGSTFTRDAWRAAGGYRPDRRRRVVRFSDRDFQLRVAVLFPVAVCPETALSLWRSDSSVDADRHS